MTVYVIAELAIHDRARYSAYAARFMDVLSAHDAELLAADEAPQVVEGSWQADKVVLLSFPDTAAFRAWYESAEYQAIVRDRHAAAHGPVLLVHSPG